MSLLIRAGAGALAGVLLFAAVHAGFSNLDLSFQTDRPEQRRMLRGFHPPESAAGGDVFAWTERSAEWRLHKLDRSYPWAAVLRVRPAAPIAAGPAAIVLVDGLRIATVDAPDYSDVAFTIPSSSRTGVVITLSAARTVVPGPSDPRELGAAVQWLRLGPSGFGRAIPPWYLTLAAAAVGAAFAGLTSLAALTIAEAAAVVLFTCAIWSALAVMGFAPVSTFDADSVRALSIVAAAGLLVIAWRARGSWTIHAGRAVVLVAAFTFLRVCFVLHPSFVLGDSGFHLHRLEAVLRGEYFFLSNAPGGAFPYAPAFYVVAGLLTSFTRGWITLMRVVTVTTDAIAAFILFPLVLRHWERGGAAVVAVLLYLVIPAGFQVQAIAYLTNAFAQSLAVIGLALLVLARQGHARWLALIASFAALTVAMLSHTGTFFILCVLLALLPLALWWRGDAAARRLAPAAAAVGAAAVLASVALYYGHFVPQYRAMLNRPAASPSTQSAAPKAPIQRAEAHQTQWAPGWVPLRNRLAAVPGYVSKYLGFVLVLSAGVGLALLARDRARDALTLLLLAWCAACVLFFTLGQFTSIDVRYYLAAFPALAVLAARAIDEGWVHPGPTREAAAAVLAWCVATGVAYWFPWLGPILPR